MPKSIDRVEAEKKAKKPPVQTKGGFKVEFNKVTGPYHSANVFSGSYRVGQFILIDGPEAKSLMTALQKAGFVISTDDFTH